MIQACLIRDAREGARVQDLVNAVAAKTRPLVGRACEASRAIMVIRLSQSWDGVSRMSHQTRKVTLGGGAVPADYTLMKTSFPNPA